MLTKFQKQKKNSFQSMFFSIFLLALVLAFIVFLIISNFNINHKRAILNERIASLKKEIETLEAGRQELQAQINRSSEETYLEKEARERFNLKKPGEEVVTVLPAEEKEGVKEEKSFWQNIFEKIKF